jgi:hypothetical protein
MRGGGGSRGIYLRRRKEERKKKGRREEKKYGDTKTHYRWSIWLMKKLIEEEATLLL